MAEIPFTLSTQCGLMATQCIPARADNSSQFVFNSQPLVKEFRET